MALYIKPDGVFKFVKCPKYVTYIDEDEDIVDPIIGREWLKYGVYARKSTINTVLFEQVSSPDPTTNYNKRLVIMYDAGNRYPEEFGDKMPPINKPIEKATGISILGSIMIFMTVCKPGYIKKEKIVSIKKNKKQDRKLLVEQVLSMLEDIDIRKSGKYTTKIILSHKREYSEGTYQLAKMLGIEDPMLERKSED